mgnify:CR=1 FL=1
MKNRVIFLDSETTGFSFKAGHRIIEIGAVEYLDLKATGNRFHVYIDPQRDIDRRAQEVHGINSEMLKGKPTFPQIAEDLIAFVKGADLIAHNASFDEGHINNELALAGYDLKLADCCNNVIDSLDMAKELFPGKKHNLDALCDKLGVDRSRRIAHGALLDAEILAEVTIKMVEKKSLLEQIKHSGQSNVFVDSIQSYASVRFVAPDEKQVEHDAFLKRIGAKTQEEEVSSAPRA